MNERGTTKPVTSTLEEARASKAKLRAKLNRPEWMTGGIGVTFVPADKGGGYAVYVGVRALTDEVKKAVPEYVDGVPVVIDVVGKIIAT